MMAAVRPVPAISLHQPWASLLFEPAFKEHETRSWRYPAGIHGSRILIQAAKRPPRRSELPEELLRIMDVCGIVLNDLPLGAFVGSAQLAGAFKASEVRETTTHRDRLTGNFEDGRFAWRLDDRRKLSPPISTLGRQGFWYLRQSTFDAATLKEHDLA